MTTTDARARALAFLTSKKSGVLATLSDMDEPRARLLYYSADDEFNIYFLTLAHTRKIGDLRAHPRVAFTVFDEEVPQTLQIEGEATDITNSPVTNPIIETLFENLKMNDRYYAPLARFDRSDVRFFRITPSWVRWGDFTQGHTTDEVLFEIPV